MSNFTKYNFISLFEVLAMVKCSLISCNAFTADHYCIFNWMAGLGTFIYICKTLMVFF